MSAAGGARIGTRGPGETQLEVDRRRIVRRIHKLETELSEIERHRDTQRKAQRRSQLAKLVIVGYTNAGKSTLLNRLTDAGVLVEDRLFATLDATTRRLMLPGGESLVTDTVGFIRKLPHQLVQAFKSTLTWPSTPICWCTSSTPAPRRSRQHPPWHVLPRSVPATSPSCWRSTRPTWPLGVRAVARRARGVGVAQRHHRRGRRPCWP
jgi:hypothetical protein